MNDHPSVSRVKEAAAKAGLDISVVTFQTPVKTAQAAADEIGCTPAQIANSLVFEGKNSGDLILLLTSGGHRVDLEKAAQQIGEPLDRAKPDRIRTETGFVIGGVAPIGHLRPIKTYIDETLFTFESIWAAGGIAETVFETTASALERATSATRFTPN